ncbi:MAG TPA: universal stress protein [Gemmataceae bacterium]|nr:universal stress protein [Gemmataceae bacterium]
MIHLKTILHPTDFSQASGYALEMACALARDQAARVILLHVVPRPVPIGRDPLVPAFKEAHTVEDLETYRQEVKARLERLRGEAPYARVEVLLKEGDVAGVIARTAEETASDLIVMGSHGRSRMYQLMMGSVAAEVTRHAPCPVVTVRVPAPAKAEG